MIITAEQMKKAMESGYDVCVIVNGEYYDFQPEEKESAADIMKAFYIDTENDSIVLYSLTEIYDYLKEIFSSGPVWFSLYDEDYNIIVDYNPETDKCFQFRENADYFRPDYYELEKALEPD